MLVLPAPVGAHTSRFSTPRYAASYIRLCMRFKWDTPANAGRAQSWSSATGTSRSRSARAAGAAAGTRTSSYPLCVVRVVPGGKIFLPPEPPAPSPRSAAKISSSVAARSFFSVSSARSQSPSQSAPKGSPTDSSHSSRGSPSPRASLRPTLRASFFFSFSSFLSRALVMVTEALGAPEPPPTRARRPSASSSASSPKRRRAAATRPRSASAIAPRRSMAPMINSTPASPKKSKSSAATTSSDLSSGEANARRATVCAASSQFSTPEISRQRALSHDSCAVAAEAVASRRSFPSPCRFSFSVARAPAIEAARSVSAEAASASDARIADAAESPKALTRSRLRDSFASIRVSAPRTSAAFAACRVPGATNATSAPYSRTPAFASSGETVARIGSGFRSSVSGFNSPSSFSFVFFSFVPSPLFRRASAASATARSRNKPNAPVSIGPIASRSASISFSIVRRLNASAFLDARSGSRAYAASAISLRYSSSRARASSPTASNAADAASPS